MSVRPTSKYAGQDRQGRVRLLDDARPDEAHAHDQPRDDQVRRRTCASPSPSNRPGRHAERAGQARRRSTPWCSTRRRVDHDDHGATPRRPRRVTTTTTTTTSGTHDHDDRPRHDDHHDEGLTLQAIILVGGKGTRLRPLTYETPKQMLPLVGVPMIECVLESLARHGVTDAVLSLGYLPDRFTEAYPDEPDRRRARGLRRRARTARHRRRHPLRRRPRPSVDETFLVVNGDVRDRPRRHDAARRSTASARRRGDDRAAPRRGPLALRRRADRRRTDGCSPSSRSRRATRRRPISSTPARTSSSPRALERIAPRVA